MKRASAKKSNGVVSPNCLLFLMIDMNLRGEKGRGRVRRSSLRYVVLCKPRRQVADRYMALGKLEKKGRIVCVCVCVCRRGDSERLSKLQLYEEGGDSH